MGAFFLYKDGTDINHNAVQEVFTKKGFTKPKIFNLNGMKLWLYKKQLIDEDNYIENSQGASLFSVGTVVYRGLSYRASLEKILEDYVEKKLDLDEIIGNFCLLFFHRKKIEILLDPLYSYHIFVNEDKTILSSSFLALLCSHKKPLRMNQSAFYEKISMGYIIGPDTFVSSIQQITPELSESLNSPYFTFLPTTNKCEVPSFSGGFDDCITYQLDLLRSKIKQIRSLADEYAVDLGLSGGYDSRLLLLLCLDAGLQVSAHTHFDRFNTHHLVQHNIAKQICQKSNIQLRAIETQWLSKHSEDSLQKILCDSLYYFDGRSSNNMGAFSETYTRTYKIRTLGSNRLSLNGQGGEIYRNYYHTSRKKINFKQWALHHIFFENIMNFLGSKSIWNEVYDNIINKISKRVEENVSEKATLETIHRYYGYVLIPDCETNINDGHNQLTFYLTPFINCSLICASRYVIPHLGTGGRFETALMQRLNPDIASIESHYGYSFTNKALKAKIKDWVIAYIPDAIWNMRNQYLVRHTNSGNEYLNEYLEMVQGNTIMREIDEALFDFFPNVDWHSLTRNHTARRSVVYIGSFLREFSSMLNS